MQLLKLSMFFIIIGILSSQPAINNINDDYLFDSIEKKLCDPIKNYGWDNKRDRNNPSLFFHTFAANDNSDTGRADAVKWKITNGWGKRANSPQWDSFKSSWGKRYWSTLTDIQNAPDFYVN